VLAQFWLNVSQMDLVLRRTSDHVMFLPSRGPLHETSVWWKDNETRFPLVCLVLGYLKNSFIDASEFMNSHGTYMDSHAFLAANMECFIRDMYKERLEQLCSTNQEQTPQFKHAKAKYLHWCTISDKLATECSHDQVNNGSETWSKVDMPPTPTTSSSG